MISAFKPKRLSYLVATGLLASASLTHGAGQAPDAGTILQQLQPSLPAQPKTERPALDMTAPPRSALPVSAPFDIRSIQIVGNTAFSAETLHALVADQEQRTQTLTQLEAAVNRITRYYQQHGYPLASAMIPAQTISGGVIVVQIIEAHYGRVQIDNRSKVRSSLLAATASGLQAGQVIAERELDRTLLLMSDIPGLSVNALLKPGSEVGTSDLAIVTSPTTAGSASVVLDNNGDRYVGRARLGGNASLYNLLGYGDILSMTALSSGSGLNFDRIGYEVLLNGAGTRAGLSYSILRYKLEGDAEPLDAYGTAGVASTWIRHPLLRSDLADIYGQAEYDGKRLRDSIGVSGIHTDRHLDNGVLSLNGDFLDSLLAGAATTWSFLWTAGHVGFDNAAAASADANSVRSAGNFSKWNLTVSRLQNLRPGTSLYLNLGAQWADSNLDSAEKLVIGGPYTVRAYDVGAISADTGYVATLEMRQRIGAATDEAYGTYGTWEALAFIDSASVRINQRSIGGSSGVPPGIPLGVPKNHATLSGVGLGINWSAPQGWHAATYLATRVGAAPVQVSKPASARIWFTLAKAF